MSGRPGKKRAQQVNNKGPCPTNLCKHPPLDHRPIANTKKHFCYSCMLTCTTR